MKLVVVGKEDLDTLTEWVRERFEAVPVRTTDAKSRLVYDNQVLEKEQTGVRYLLTPTAILPTNPSSIT